MNTLLTPKVGASYDLAPLNPIPHVDGTVTVLEVGPIGPELWAKVAGRMRVPVDELEPGEPADTFEDAVWLVRADRLAPAANGPCQACGGSGGHTEVEVDGHVIRQTWHPCGKCHGSGVAQ